MVRNVEIKIERKGKKEERKEESTDIVRNLMAPPEVRDRLGGAGEVASGTAREGSRQSPDAS